MEAYSFLAALPAVLGLAGFVLYQLLSSRQSGDSVTLRIVDKLRRNAPNLKKLDERLNAKHVQQLLQQHQELRKYVNEQDFALLQQALRQQFLVSVMVYVVAVLFCGLSVFLFNRQSENNKALKISGISLANTVPDAAGLVIDLDPLQVSWRSSGEAEELQVYLENPQTKVRTEPISVSSSQHRAVFQPDQYRRLLTNRSLDGTNPVRALLQATNEVFTSLAADVQVGIKILTIVDDRAKLTVAAMIDNRRVDYYDFEAKVLIPAKVRGERDIVVGPDIPYRFPARQIKHPGNLDWARARGVYFGPSNPKIVRFEFLIDDSVKSSS